MRLIKPDKTPTLPLLTPLKLTTTVTAILDAKTAHELYSAPKDAFKGTRTYAVNPQEIGTWVKDDYCWVKDMLDHQNMWNNSL